MKSLLSHLSRSGLFQLVLKIFFTVLVFYVVFHGIDFSQLKAEFRKQDHGMLGLAALLLGIQMVVGAFRWQLVINTLIEEGGQKIGRLLSMKIYYISMFFTCCLPGAVGGDMVRVWLAKSENMPLPVSINSVIIDRMIALVALVLMVVITMPILGSSLGFDVSIILPCLALLTLIGVWLIFNAERLLKSFTHFRVVHWLLYLISSIRLILKKPLSCFVTLTMALIGQVIYALSAFVLAQSLQINMTALQSITLMPPVMLATTLPISIGGWGVREIGIIGMLSIIGIPQVSALALSLQLGLLSVVISLPASILWLSHRKNSPNNSGGSHHGIFGTTT